GYY
ncbi:sensor evgS domain protein, partial [Escherichia coli 95.0183]